MKNILMIDIETTGQNPGCRVLTIGAFGFNKDGNQCQFYKRFNAIKLHEEGFKDELSTMDWWTKQDNQAFIEAFGGQDDPQESIGNAGAHNALEDAKAQMRGLRDFFKRAESGALT